MTGRRQRCLVEEHVGTAQTRNSPCCRHLPSAVARLETSSTPRSIKNNTSCHCQHERKHQIQPRIRPQVATSGGIPQRAGVIDGLLANSRQADKYAQLLPLPDSDDRPRTTETKAVRL